MCTCPCWKWLRVNPKWIFFLKNSTPISGLYWSSCKKSTTRLRKFMKKFAGQWQYRDRTGSGLSAYRWIFERDIAGLFWRDVDRFFSTVSTWFVLTDPLQVVTKPAPCKAATGMSRDWSQYVEDCFTVLFGTPYLGTSRHPGSKDVVRKYVLFFKTKSSNLTYLSTNM